MNDEEPSLACDALVIGAGPAGTCAAILLALAGWRVTLVEQQTFPRQKVCGECIAAGNLALLHELGVGDDVLRLAGPELKYVGWMHNELVVSAAMPACAEDALPYGRAIGRDVFDTLMLARARKVGVRVLQPARVGSVRGAPGAFVCEVAWLDATRGNAAPPPRACVSASIILDAHGSWEAGPVFSAAPAIQGRAPHAASDLFAFKASFADSSLRQGWLPVVAVRGGYGGVVTGDNARTTLALCLRRDALRELRGKHLDVGAGGAVESFLRQSCRGIREALQDARREGGWLAVGPLRPGVRLREMPGVFAVGNAAGETHPLIGEGISMALQSSRLLVHALLRHADRTADLAALRAAHAAYVAQWRTAFMPRLRLAAMYAHLAMNAPLAAATSASLKKWPLLLTHAARFAGKARPMVRLTR